MRRSLIATTAAFAAVLLVSACSSGESDTATSTTVTDTTTTTAATTTTQEPLDTSAFGVLPPIPETGVSTTDCTYPEATPAIRENVPPPSFGVSTFGTVDVAVTTSQGPIGLTLDRAAAPCTVNSFVSLAGQDYFADSPCHRLTTSQGLSVLQCGDPSGDGNRGPGYQFANEYPTAAFEPEDPALASPVVYPRGTLAMANAGPDTNGSQFFLVYENSVLAPQYTVFGTISEEGLATLDEIADAGTSTPGNDGPPAAETTIESVLV